MKMKLWNVGARYGGVVVAAATAEDALQIAREQYPQEDFDADDIGLLQTDKPGVVVCFID
jgi:hypothetical protein